MILNLLEHLLGGIKLDLVILNLTLKIVQERRFFRNLFSQGNGVGLRLYTDYMISKNGYDWFHRVVTCFVLKMEFFGKMIKRDELVILKILSKLADETHMYTLLHSYVI